MPCPSDEQLQALVEHTLDAGTVDWIEAHCSQCPECAQVVDELARQAVPAETLLEGRYQLGRVLGSGGMGVVHEALDTRLGRKVAVKRLHRSRFGSSRRTRFLAEAQILASLAHPNVLTVYDAGGSEDHERGALFLVMELVDGWSIDQWIVQQHPSFREILDAFCAAGEGLAAAHERGIVHRDVKPQNILVSRHGRVFMADFGLAALRGGDFAGVNPTATGTLLGTPAYMAPEQIAGDPADASSDQFGFCVALYEALHGCRPRVGAPPKRGPNRSVPVWIDHAVWVGLQPRPAERHASMRELLRALREPPRWRARTGLVGIAAVLAVGAAVLTAFLAKPLRPASGPGPAQSTFLRGPGQESAVAPPLPAPNTPESATPSPSATASASAETVVLRMGTVARFQGDAPASATKPEASGASPGHLITECETYHRYQRELIQARLQNARSRGESAYAKGTSIAWVTEKEAYDRYLNALAKADEGTRKRLGRECAATLSNLRQIIASSAECRGEYAYLPASLCGFGK